MPNLVTSGAILSCSYGVAPSTLVVPGGLGVSAGGNPVATTPDSKTNVNILPFGLCNSPNSPYKSATGAPCIPSIATPWTGSTTVLAGGLPVVNSASQCRCQYGGVIQVMYAGQPATTAG